MNCPNCKSESNQVTDCRNWQGGNGQTGIRRRRECLKCRTRFSTIELIMEITRGFYATEENTQRVEQITKDMAMVNGNGHKPAKPTPKPKKSKKDLKKQLDMALRRARVRAIKIEDEDELLGEPDLIDEDDLDLSELEDDDFDDL